MTGVQTCALPISTVTINGKTLIAGQDFVYVNAAAKTDGLNNSLNP